jgi:hypothetical protein
MCEVLVNCAGTLEDAQGIVGAMETLARRSRESKGLRRLLRALLDATVPDVCICGEGVDEGFGQAGA